MKGMLRISYGLGQVSGCVGFRGFGLLVLAVCNLCRAVYERCCHASEPL